MANLVEQVGRDFFNAKYAGSYFFDDKGKPSLLVHSSGGEVYYRKLGGSVDKLSVEEARISDDFFLGHETFATPPLGWRTRSKGRYLTYFTRNNRSYRRGLNSSNLQVAHSPMTKWLLRSGNIINDLSDNMLCMMTMKPSYMPFSTGVALIREGKILSFAASSTVAVVVGEDDHLNIFFREKVCGRVTPEGTIVVATPMLNAYLGELQ